MNDLAGLRDKIDAIDTDLLRLLNERALLAKEIGAIKNLHSLPIYSPVREMKLLRSLVERSEGPLTREAIHAIYREIMSASIALEKDVAIACPGPIGSPSHRIALAKFGSSVRYLCADSIAGVFQDVATGKADCGVVPLEDPGHGFLNATLDELAHTTLSICAEISPDSSANDKTSDGRYIIIGSQINTPSGNDQTMVLLRIENKPGSLVAALEPFKEMHINLTHFATRAARAGDETLFFVQTDGHKSDLQVPELLEALAKNCHELKILGSYPKPLL